MQGILKNKSQLEGKITVKSDKAGSVKVKE
jgi:hypothetical protein